MTFTLLVIFKFLLMPFTPAAEAPKTIYDFKAQGLEGGTIDFAKYKGKKILIVNTASKCGYTPQYEALEKTYEKYKDRMVIIGFPANNFGAQEPGTNGEIAEFCKKNYGVSFPMAAKISVKGDDMAPIYKWLTQKQLNGFQDSEVKWNFQKYLINEKGELVHVFLSNVKPDSKELADAIAQ